MNILFLADPHSIHDEKWITYFSENKLNTTYLLPRAGHAEKKIHVPHPSGAVVLKPIVDFSVARFFKTAKTAFEVRSIIVKHKIDIIHILYAEPNSLWCLFRRYFATPMIITSRGTDVLKTIQEVFEKTRLINHIVAPAYKKAFQMADWITCTSQNQIESVVSFSGSKEKITIIRTGVDLKRLETKAALPIALADSKYVLFPRYIRPLYNHEFSLEAINLLPPSVKIDYKMVFLGRDNGDSSYQNFLEKKMKATRNVEFVFLPEQSQNILFELYKKASLVVMTPRSDGSPVSAMETILCGTKLILGPLNYDDEIFSEAVIKLKSWDVEELTEAMVNTLKDSTKSNGISPRLKQLVDRDYNMNQMELIYKTVLHGS